MKFFEVKLSFWAKLNMLGILTARPIFLCMRGLNACIVASLPYFSNYSTILSCSALIKRSSSQLWGNDSMLFTVS